jgi:hypothetical protein
MGISCATAPAAVEPAPVQVEPRVVEPAAPEPIAPVVEEPVVEAPAPVEEVFNVTQEVYDTTKTDVQKLIEDLNQIIRAQNYNSWSTHLSVSFKALISSSEFLAERSEELYKRDQTVASNMGRDPKLVRKVVLRTARDYFTNVVVPAHENDRVDDIEFITANQVRAYTSSSRGERLILYNLENTDGEWKITN